MKNCFFRKIPLRCLLCLLIVTTGWDIDNSSAKQVPVKDSNLPKKIEQSFQDPIEYVLGKFRDYDLVMIGERHWVRQEPIFIQTLIKRCFEENAINVVLLEFGNFEDQGDVDAFMNSAEYDPKPAIDVLRNSYEFGWGYQEYFDIFKLIHDENSKRPPTKKVRLVLADLKREGIYFDGPFYECLKLSPLPDKQRWQMITWLRESIADRDQCMAAIIEAHVFGLGLKGIYYAGSSHIRRDLQKKDYGRQYFSAGGILAHKYPGRVCCLTFHKKREFWQEATDFSSLEELFKSLGKPFAVDTNDSRISHLRLKGEIVAGGIALAEAFDGYIMLNRDDDYQPCALVPGFYDDEFAKVVWDRLRKRKILERFPPEFERFKTETPTGEELMKMIKEGLH